MDFYVDKLKVLIEQSGGIASAGDIKKAGIERTAIYACLENGIIKRESHGNYVLAGNEPDVYYMIRRHSDKLIFSHMTALFLNGLLKKVPSGIDITVPQGDNITRIKNNYRQAQFHYCKRELWNMGISQVVTPYGYEVSVYDVERCICDIIRDKNKVDSNLYNQVIKKYFGEKYNSKKILEYAGRLNVELKVRSYMEIFS